MKKYQKTPVKLIGFTGHLVYVPRPAKTRGSFLSSCETISVSRCCPGK